MAKVTTVYGNGTVFQRKDGRWEAVLSWKDETTGKRVRKSFYGESKTSAYQKLTDWRASGGVEKVQDEVAAAAEGLTVGDFLKEWLADVKEQKKYATWASYADHVQRFLVPTVIKLGSSEIRFGEIRLQKLTSSHVRAFMTALAEAKDENGKPRYSAARRRGVFVVTRIALNHAYMARGLVAQDPMRGLKPPAHTAPEMQSYSAAQVAALLEANRSEKLYPFLRVALATGARSGELRALRWDDLDEARGTITIRRTLIERRSVPGLDEGEKAPLVSTNSTKGSRSSRKDRTIPLDHETLLILHEHKLRLEKEGLLECGLMFPTANGTPILQTNLRKWFLACARRAGLPQIRVHDMRHTAATLMAQARVELPTLQSILGHAQVSTLAKYLHTNEDQKRQAVNALAAAVGGQSRQLNP